MPTKARETLLKEMIIENRIRARKRTDNREKQFIKKEIGLSKLRRRVGY